MPGLALSGHAVTQDENGEGSVHNRRGRDASPDKPSRPMNGTEESENKRQEGKFKEHGPQGV